jgi:hypothetical protein
MSTQVLGGQKRSRATVALVVLALALAVSLLLAEASSIWSTGPGSRFQRAPAQIAPTANIHFRNVGHVPDGCRVKFGCQGGLRRSSRHIPKGCRVKYGCEFSGSTTEQP